MALNLEHQVLNLLKRDGARAGTWLVAVSGGLDSLVLAEVLWRWRRKLGAKLIFAHVHHGVSEGSSNETSLNDASLNETSAPNFRDQARAFVRECARAKHLTFVTNRNVPRGLNSEAAWRDFRYRCLHRWAKEFKATHIVLAHHRDDLLETRVLRLIRGTGPEGLAAMSSRSGNLIRPLLGRSRAELETYARTLGLTWLEDPSNQSLDPLRNWVRHEWLPSLEARQSGAKAALARSLAQLVPPPRETSSRMFVANTGLRRNAFVNLDLKSQGRLLAEYVRALRIRDFGASHIAEVLKRLHSERRHFSFTVRQCCFHVTPDLVWASRVCDRENSVLS